MIIRKTQLPESGTLQQLTEYSQNVELCNNEEINNLIDLAWSNVRRVLSAKRKNCIAICKKNDTIFALPFTHKRGTTMLKVAKQFCIEHGITQYVFFKHTGIQDAQQLYGMMLSNKTEWQ